MTLKTKQRHVENSIILIGIFSIIALSFSSPIKQNLEYHHFCDINKLFGIPNFHNVTSNILFIVVGIYGLLKLNITSKLKPHYIILFIGIILTGIGSGYYHVNPNNTTLIWDRLPMTIVFMTILSIIIYEFINKKLGQTMLIPALLIGVFSIFYWVIFKDLRFYAFVQFYPMITILIILIFSKSDTTNKLSYWLLFLMYIFAKTCEYFDEFIFNLLHSISGHTLKHIISSLGLALFIYIKKKIGFY